MRRQEDGAASGGFKRCRVGMSGGAYCAGEELMRGIGRM